MARTPHVLLAVALLLVPASGAAQGAAGGSEVTSLTGTPGEGEVAVSGTAVFGGQDPVFVSEDAPGDAPGMVPAGDFGGADQTGLDLLAATLSVPDPDVAELLVEWRVSNLPPEGIPEGTRLAMSFRAGDEIYQVQAKRSNVAGPTSPNDPMGHAERLDGAFQLLGDCGSFATGDEQHCLHLLWLDGAVDPRTGTVSARVPLDSPSAPEIRHGAVLRPTGSESLEIAGVLSGIHAVQSLLEPTDDHAPFGPPGVAGYGFDVARKEVLLGVAPAGTEPTQVDYTTPATLAPDDSFTGSIAVDDPDGTDVFARACFATNCGYRSLGGANLPATDAVAVLRLGGSVDRSFAFWRGGLIGNKLEHSMPAGLGALSSCSNSPCFIHTVRVESPGAARLRIALDSARRSDEFFTTITLPGGQTRSGTNGNAFNIEFFIEDPDVGDYTILVRPSSAENNFFSMRAKLEATLPTRTPDAQGLIPPDLRPTPPYELNFHAPINPLNGLFPPDDTNPPASAAGVSPVSCAADETADDQVVRCLRFSFGLANAGQGNFDVRWNGGGFAGGEAPMFQCVERDGQEPLARPAGFSEFHTTHGHTHYKDLIQADLFRVTDPEAGTMEPVGDGKKLGYSPADQGFARWFSFEQAEHRTSGNAGNCAGTSERLGMSPGWGDVYRYQRPGNFVDFGISPDGLYVIRLAIDPLNNVLESDETNNVSYTYVRVSLQDVEVLEHGRGASPWDPSKEILVPRYRGGVPW